LAMDFVKFSKWQETKYKLIYRIPIDIHDTLPEEELHVQGKTSTS